jgi:prophage regulatory protein
LGRQFSLRFFLGASRSIATHRVSAFGAPHEMKAPKLLSLDGLRGKGITFHRTHIDRLIRAGKFPRPIKIGENKNAWLEDEIDAHIAGKKAERDSTSSRLCRAPGRGGMKRRTGNLQSRTGE